MIKCNKCEKAAVIVEREIYWCADCMLKKIGIYALDKVLKPKQRSKNDLEKEISNY